MSAITPYKIGDEFMFLGCGPHRITGRFNPTNPEYTAEYVGQEGDKYWKCERYSHSSIVITNSPKN